jgi:hypothetical protein
MKKKLFLALFILFTLNLNATSKSPSRNLQINGNVTNEKGAANGTNGSSWELNEFLAGKSGVNWFMSWDDNNLYIAREGGNNYEPILIYIQAEYPGSAYTDNSTGIVYDSTAVLFPTTGSPNWGTNGGVNFVAYIKSNYDEFRTWNGSNWSGANTNLNPQFQEISNTHNMEVAIPWAYITNNNGKPTHFRIVLLHTNGQGGLNGSYVYGASPNSTNTPNDGNQTSVEFRDWWGGFSSAGEIEPNSLTGAPLPVTLTSLNAYFDGSKVILKWTTASEINNYGFEIERSKTYSSSNTLYKWEKIGFVQGSGNSNSVKFYSFEDKNVLTDRYFYRLKQIDFDGAYEYSHTVEVFANLKPEILDIKNFPNPFNPSTRIKYQMPYSGFASIKVYDVLGNEITVLANEYKEAGIYETIFDGSNLTSGIYFIKFQLDNSTKTIKAILTK